MAFSVTSAVGTWSLISLHSVSEQACEIAATLSYDALSLNSEIDQTERDSFRRYALAAKPNPGRMLFERTLANGLLSRFSKFHVPSKFRDLAHDLNGWSEGQDPEIRTETVRELAENGKSSLHCEPSAAGKARVDEFHALAETYLHGDIDVDARTFERNWDDDVQTYCRSAAVQARLTAVQAIHAAACKNPSPQYTEGCRPESTEFAGIRNELKQLAEVQKINERKLLAKWGAGLYGKIHCK